MPTTMIFNQEVSEREHELRRELSKATKEFNAIPDLNTKESRGKLFKINELTKALKLERQSRQARERAIRSLNGETISPKVFKGFKTIAIFLTVVAMAWLYWSGDIKAELLTSGILITLPLICWLMYLFGYLYRKD